MTIDVGQGLMNAGIFLGIPFVLMVFIAQYLWERTCRTKIRVILVKEGGGSENLYPVKEGSDVTIHNPTLGVTRTWPINQLATIPTPYPELGILPRFMQREIQTTILHEGDVEPVLNRSPHRRRVVSPDVISYLKELAEANPAILESINQFLSEVSTGPTREMIASPAVLGALKASTVMKALATVGDDLMEMLKGLRAQLMRVVGLNPTYVYILLVLNVVLLGFVIYQLMQGGTTDPVLMEKVDQIHKALGIK